MREVRAVITDAGFKEGQGPSNLLSEVTAYAATNSYLKMDDLCSRPGVDDATLQQLNQLAEFMRTQNEFMRTHNQKKRTTLNEGARMLLLGQFDDINEDTKLKDGSGPAVKNMNIGEMIKLAKERNMS